jgi:hypothetical protein
MAPLYGLVYVSSSTEDLSVGDIDRLLDAARRGNARHDVTGVLLYSRGNFMQYLEGPVEGMTRVYASIKSAPQHHGIIELLHEPIARREFAEWSMAFRTTNTFGVADPWLSDELVSQRLAQSHVDRSPAHLILGKFWGRAQRPMSS